ncbi:MAG: hypothetical protein QW514_07225 [Thermoprotei archaeon]
MENQALQLHRLGAQNQKAPSMRREKGGITHAIHIYGIAARRGVLLAAKNNSENLRLKPHHPH